MMAVGRFVVCPLYGYQKPVFTQQAKQAVTPDIECFTCLTVQQRVEFACAYTWLTTPNSGNKIKNLTIVFMSFIAPGIMLVPCLSAVPQKLACACHGDFWGLTLRKDLPGRFFTTLTP